MSKKGRVYVAGPFSGAEMRNTREAVRAGRHLINMGYAAYIPHLFALVDYLEPIDYETVMEQCFSWIEACDAIYVIAQSPGTDREVAFAREKGIPVFNNLNELDKVFGKKA